MRRNKVKYIDYVEVAVEKEKYAKQRIHKGTKGMVYDLNLTNDCLEVCLDGNKRIFVSIMDLKQL